ncbi:hypothetical protein FE257_005634 [Aspergillus nanangensis]|uniref:Major facilitator superfamily (MFS) profile domain-containing protein n=1 Tax=Aspergillus nanangensis TaxID=2582783 RepID=A0AAD4CQC3_ASPNN|nr:hypothetical protein FE257_005634 [Aspergillus nanangensis]
MSEIDKSDRTTRDEPKVPPMDDKNEVSGVTFTAEEEKRLVRKIDWNLMPLLMVSYALQFLDKTSLSYSAVLGIKQDLSLVGQEYSWTSSIFYIGYLVASYPISLGFVKFPLGKYLSILIFAWGVVLTFHALSSNYASLMVLRTLLGVFESAISPGFSLITGMWYTPTEHVSRHSVWFCGNAIAGIIGSLISYGILFYPGDFAKWKILFLVFGLVTVAWSFVLWFFLPDSPLNAGFLTPEEREYVSLRPKKFQRTTQTKKWDRTQFFEAITDFKTWWFFVFAFVTCVPNGGTTSFSTLIINGFGYDVYQTILMGLPAPAFQFTAVVLTALGTSYIRKSRLIALVCIFLVGITGILMIKLLPEEQRLSRLAGFWLVTAIAPAFPVMVSLVASNIAGFTKKSTTVAMFFVTYCVGNLVGPQFFREDEAPNYKTAYTTILICFAITIVMALGFRVYLQLENRRRDREQGVRIDAEESRPVHVDADEDLDQVDETDKQNRSFRYVL